MLMRRCALVLSVCAVHAHNGYAVSFEGPTAFASLESLILDMNNTEVAKLDAGATIMAWMQYRGVSPSF